MFQSLRWRLLLSYLGVMAATLGVFGAGVYAVFSRSLYRQLDDQLLNLAQSAAPTLGNVKAQGSDYLDKVEDEEQTWRDIFNRDQQSIEWFNDDGRLLARKGVLSLSQPPRLRSSNLQVPGQPYGIRAYTISVFSEGSLPTQPVLEGYIRASISTEDVSAIRNQFLWGLGVGGTAALGLVGVGGLWLTRKATQPVEQSYELLREFTADASHELRSPLTAIQTSIEVMQNHPERIHPLNAKKMDAIASAVDQMARLAADLLFLARTDATGVAPTLNRETIGLHALLQNVVELLIPQAETKAIGLDIRLPLASEIYVAGDRSHLRRLFSNLLENALQYTPAGGRVTLATKRSHWGAVVSVEDTGIGIAPEALPHVFERFWRADRARSRRNGGSGLGLAIAQAIARKHGGEIVVTSEVNVGTCFRVRLPSLTATALGNSVANGRTSLEKSEKVASSTSGPLVRQ
jgi:signal transduction histidine kinase